MKAILNPNLYHGKNKNSNFFEGWYFKIVSADRNHTFAFIPGVSISDDSHCFIQVLNGEKNKYTYCRFSFHKFSYSNSPFSINIDLNSFSLNKLQLNIFDNDTFISGSLYFNNLVSWNDSFINPGSMGFYNYLKFMECYSQVCAMNGDIQGSLTINNELIDFHGGKVYIEKNWGRSFPLGWLWIQSNCFKEHDVSLTCSLGEIPFPLKDFTGFLIGITLGDVFYKFTTINRSHLKLYLEDNDIRLEAFHKNIQLTLSTKSCKDNFILCYGPTNGKMSPYVRESLSAEVNVDLINTKNGDIIYSGKGYNTGIEYGGKLMNGIKSYRIDNNI